jgi:hypothetical protein
MSFALTAETAFQFWEQLDCPTSLKLWLLANAGQWAEVLTAKVSPEHFNCPRAYARANAAVCFLKKNPAVPGSGPSIRRKACLESWRAGEASCYKTNERLSEILVSPLSGDAPAQFLGRVRKTLIAWLGYGPSDEEIKAFARHGPGTTFSSTAVSPTAADKYDETITLTPGAVWHLANIAGTLWFGHHARFYDASLRSNVQVIRGNRFTTVPKTAMTDRGISIEGSLNIYFQLAVGRSLRARLRQRTGWDLDHAATIHRKMAQVASRDGSYATLDLTNASDSLAKNLVKILFRETRWLEYMEDLRSPRTFVDGSWHLLEKFSSMGNGYTFELETCVFAAIISECLKLKGHSGLLGYDCFVFGDDLIVPTNAAQFVVDVMRWCGFETNPAKTFITGSFRESCGADFYAGEPVRGFYLKDKLEYGTQRVYTVHNGAKVCLGICGVSAPWYLDWLRNNLLPLGLRDLGGSERLGDSVLWGVKPQFRWKCGIRWVRAMRWSAPVIVPWSFFSITSRLACRLTGHGETFGIMSRGSLFQPRTTWVSDS